MEPEGGSSHLQRPATCHFLQIGTMIDSFHSLDIFLLFQIELKRLWNSGQIVAHPVSISSIEI
jgi:hypothetical protein